MIGDIDCAAVTCLSPDAEVLLEGGVSDDGGLIPQLIDIAILLSGNLLSVGTCTECL